MLQLILPVPGAIHMFFSIVMCFLSCVKAMIHRFVTTSLTALAIKPDLKIPLLDTLLDSHSHLMADGKYDDIDDGNYLQQLQLYLMKILQECKQCQCASKFRMAYNQRSSVWSLNEP